MTRRVLLIDSDVMFEHTLRQQLAPFRIDVDVAEEDSDPLGAVTEPPELIIIAVDEPQKSGYALCNKAKRGALANVPVLLVTATVSPDGFANHAKLKAHADAYLDKREMSLDELLGKIDNLIELGDAAEVNDYVIDEVIDDSPIQVEIDSELGGDVPLPIVTDEDEFVEVGTQMSSTPTDALLDKETDDAFDALTSGFGDDSEPLAVPAVVQFPSIEPALQREQASDAFFEQALAVAPTTDHPALDAQVADASDHDVLVASDESDAAPEVEAEAPLVLDDEAISEVMVDDAVRGDDIVVDEAVRGDDIVVDEVMFGDEAVVDEVIVGESELDAAADLAIASLDFEDSADEVPRSMATVSPDRLAVEASRPATIPPPHVEPPAQSIMVPRPATIPPFGSQRRPSTPPTTPPQLMNVVPTTSARASTLLEEPVPPSALPPRPKNTTGARSFVNTPTVIDTIAGREPRPTAGFGLDLGLDEVAADANREQSQVADRRSLKRSHDLEMRIKQLEAEVQHAGAQREQDASTVQELVRVRQDVAAKELEVAHLRDRMMVLEHAKAAAESKNGQLEQRLFELMETDKASNQAELRVAELEQAVANSVAQLAQLQAQQVATGNANSAQLQQLRVDHDHAIAQAHVALAAAQTEGEHHVVAAAASAAALEHAHQEIAQLVATTTTTQQENLHLATVLAQAQHAAAQQNTALVADLALAQAAAEQRDSAIAQLQAAHALEIENVQREQQHQLALAVEERLANQQVVHEAALIELQRQLGELGSHHDAAQRAIAVHLADQAGIKQTFGQEVASVRSLLTQQEAENKDLRDQAAHTEQQLEQASNTADALRREMVSKVAELQRALQEAETAGASAQEAAVNRAVAEASAAHKAEVERALADAARQHASDLAQAVAHAVSAQQAEAGQLLIEAVQRHQVERDQAVAAVSEKLRAIASADVARISAAAQAEAEELRAGLASARERQKALESAANQVQHQIATMQEAQRHVDLTVIERDQRIIQLQSEIATLENENTGYQEQVLKAYQKIKNDEALVARAKKAMAIALTVLDDTNKATDG